MPDHDPSQNPAPAAYPCDLPMPEPGSVVDGVLYLFDPDPYAREDLILGDRGSHDFVVEVHGENSLLAPGWVLFGNDEKTLFKALTHWDTNGWQPVSLGDGLWALHGIPSGNVFSEPRLYEVALARPETSAEMARESFLDACHQEWLEGSTDESGWLFTPVPRAVQSILDSRRNCRHLASEYAARMGIPVPEGLSPQALNVWITEHAAQYHASYIAELLGIQAPTERDKLDEWVEEWGNLCEPLEYAGIQPPDIARLKEAWLAETHKRAA